MAEARGFIDEEAAKAVKEALALMVAPVRILLVVNDGIKECKGCDSQKSLLLELKGLSEKIELRVLDSRRDASEVERYAIPRYPATILDREGGRIRYYGVTAGTDFSTLLEDILMMSTKSSGLDPQLEKLVFAIDKVAHIQVMVSLTCPYCPKMVRLAHQFAFVNPLIRADMVEVAEFPEMVRKYEVRGVPRTVINETHRFDGLVPGGRFYMELLKAVDPESYQQLEQALRSMEGKRKAKQADPEREYDVAVVGGGPAGMSAALYATRKGLKVVLIAKGLGGQVNYTARVENYLGVPEVSGPEMVEAFRDHAESYSIEERLGANLEEVERRDDLFLLRLEDGAVFKARSLVFCGGMEYKRLGVPGEERLIGKGLAFCATCDAPLFSGKSVAVIGGGNSAFTSLRDLLPFASSIHLIHHRKEFRADRVLVEEALGSVKVTTHTPFEVEGFVGEGQLRAVMIKDLETGERSELPVDGAFLEIGMEAKAGPISRLVRLNQRGEVPVRPDMSTETEGLFAAGDVTDVEDKQISVAVGDGARAALSAHRYLLGKGKAPGPAKDSWQQPS